MSTRQEPVLIGAPPGRLSDWTITPLHFIGFTGLPTTKGAGVHSSKFSFYGHQWIVKLYPGGAAGSNDGYVALTLVNRTEAEIEVEFKFIIKHPNGEGDISKASDKLFKFSPRGSDVDGDVGPAQWYENFYPRSLLLNCLVDGTLIIEVHMRTNKPGQQPAAPFVPGYPTLQNMLKDFGNEETADVDVKFEVGGAVESATGRPKQDQTSTSTFHAHHYALRLNAPALADMCNPGDVSAPTAINNIQPATFKDMLYYCYGGKISEDNLRQNAKEIIEAADRFGVVNLKLEAEACYVDTVELTLDNIIGVVTYADSKNLALLKERCMDFLSSADKIEVARNVSFDDMPPRLVKDLMETEGHQADQGPDSI
ncbi:hypothetical protein THAOC_34224 [Thalassiosira oceanica]|uniref:MATH domain-containing protein n=1 Tax=Thalassiosira oceanica TaxID=159749 RepID=K0RK56_THAOC|nr:hypothetical protein THAOC_34224 [Thalassiosira oceanica]|eukprot:EJK47082.1 hypothetical protein THAOC_34224 [Thalassiosira oceanica]